MRATVWLTVSALALALAACSPKQAAAPSPPPPAPASEPAPPPTAASAPGPESAPAAAPTPENAAPTGPAAAVAPAAPPPYRFSPGDFPKQERRIAALIANAESRDTSGETQYLADQGRAQRARCATRSCAEQAYAAEEARLRKWEGSSDIK